MLLGVGLVVLVILVGGERSGSRTEAVRMLGERDSPIRSLCFAPRHPWLASCDMGGRLVVWDVEAGRQQGEWGGEGQSITCVAFAPDGLRMAWGARDGRIVIWDLEQWRDVGVMKSGVEAVTVLAYAPDGKTMASGDRQGTVCLWEVETGRLNQQHAVHSGAVSALAISNDGQWLATAGVDGCIRVRSMQVGAARRVYQVAAMSFIRELAFLPEGDGIVWADERRGLVGRCDLTREAPIRLLLESSHQILAVALAAEGATLAVGRLDGSLELRDLETLALVNVMQSRPEAVSRLAISEDGRTVALAGFDGRLEIWQP